MTNKVHERRAVNDALKVLPHAERTKIVQESLDAALNQMPDDQSRQIVNLASDLADRVHRVGPTIAIEILAAIGILWDSNGCGR